MIDLFSERLRVASVELRNDAPVLVYDPAWAERRGAFPISLSMPLDGSIVATAQLLPWLANLLPESHLSEIGQQIGVAPQDILGLLSAIGHDNAGALSIGRPRRGGDEFRLVGAEIDLRRIIAELLSKPFLVGEEGVSRGPPSRRPKPPGSCRTCRPVLTRALAPSYMPSENAAG